MSKVTHECTDAQAQGCRRPTVAGLQGHLHVLGHEARVDVDGAELVLNDADLLAVVLLGLGLGLVVGVDTDLLAVVLLVVVEQSGVQRSGVAWSGGGRVE